MPRIVMYIIIFGLFWGYNHLVDTGFINEPDQGSIFYSVYAEDKDVGLIEDIIYQKTNELRTEKGLSPLSRSEQLDSIAKKHSQNMASNNFFLHSNGNYGENIAKTPWYNGVVGCGDTTHNREIADCIVKGWRNSPGHYANIMGSYGSIGIGVAFDSNGNALSTQTFT